MWDMWIRLETDYFIPNSFANLFLRPAFDVGMPLAFAIFRFAVVMPSARFQLKDRPGILNDDFFLRAMFHLTVCRSRTGDILRL